MKKNEIRNAKPFYCEACERPTDEFNCPKCGDRTVANV